MDELETRILALEVAFIELIGALAETEAGAIEQARDSIKAGLAGAGDGLERTVRGQAIELFEDGLRRYRFGSGGAVLPGGGSTD